MELSKEEREKGASQISVMAKEGKLLDAGVAMIFNPVSVQVAIIDFFSGFIYNILRMACVPAELLMRRNFGERHFNIYMYFGGMFWFWIWASGFINFGIGQSGVPTVSNAAIFSVFGFVFFGLMAWHLIIRPSFFKVQLDRYSKYDGDILPFLYKLPYAKDSQGYPKEYFVRQVYEPIFMGFAGFIIAYALNPQTGTWIMVSAIGMAVKEYVQAQRVRNIILDQIDAEILAKSMAGAMKGEPAKNNNGVYIAGLPNEGKLKQKFREVISSKQERFSIDAD